MSRAPLGGPMMCIFWQFFKIRIYIVHFLASEQKFLFTCAVYFEENCLKCFSIEKEAFEKGSFVGRSTTQSLWSRTLVLL